VTISYHIRTLSEVFNQSELDRLDMTHRMMILLCDERLHLAPIGELPQRILDVGTGTGIWCMEMGPYKMAVSFA